jgi:hypothetical protein
LAGRDVACASDDIVDKELLAEILAQFLRNDARENVGRASRRKPDNQAHRPYRIRLRTPALR